MHGEFIQFSINGSQNIITNGGNVGPGGSVSGTTGDSAGAGVSTSGDFGGTGLVKCDSNQKYIIYENELPSNVIQYRTYTNIDSNGYSHKFFSYDATSDLSKYSPLGLSLILLIFSIYLFYVATKLYHQYHDKELKEEFVNVLICVGAAGIVIGWIFLCLYFKKIPPEFWKFEFLYYPNQFVLGVLLSSLLLLGIGIFRFAIIAFLPTHEDNVNTPRDKRFSLVGLVFTLISLAASLLTIWTTFKK